MTQSSPRKRLTRGRIALLVAAMAVLYVLAGVGGGWLYRAKLAPSWNSPKLDTPVVVIESDDWGIDFVAPDGKWDLVRYYCDRMRAAFG